jgi:hypothetical protein
MSTKQQLTNALKIGMKVSWEEQWGGETIITLNQDDWEVLDEDHEDNEWGEPILYEAETTRSMTLEYLHNQRIQETIILKDIDGFNTIFADGDNVGIDFWYQRCEKCKLIYPYLTSFQPVKDMSGEFSLRGSTCWLCLGKSRLNVKIIDR